MTSTHSSYFNTVAPTYFDALASTDPDVRRLLPEQGVYAVGIAAMIRKIEHTETKTRAYACCRTATMQEPTFRSAFRRARSRAIKGQKDLVRSSTDKAELEAEAERCALRLMEQQAKDQAAALKRQALVDWAESRGLKLYGPDENPFAGTQFA